MGAEPALVAELLSYESRVRAFFSRELGDEYEADDLTQEALFSAWRSLGGFRRESSMCTWVHGVAKRVLWNYYRTKARRPVTDGYDDALPGPRFDAEPEPLSALALEAALEELSRGERSLYERFYRQRQCIRLIAAEDGESEGTVKFRLFELRKRLRSRLA